MSRTLSTTAINAINARETDEVFVILLEINHATLAQPIRVNSSGADIIHDGDAYLYYPFELDLPDEVEGKTPRAKLRIDNIDRQIVLAVRTMTSAADVTFKIVLASDPDTIEAEFPNFKLVNISYDANVIEGDLTLENLYAEPYPSGTFTPTIFPGMF